MAATRALAATGEQITNSETYVSSALAFPVQAYLPAVNAGAAATVPVGRRIEVQSTAGGTIELLTEKGKRVGVVPARSIAFVVARSGAAQSEDSSWHFDLVPDIDVRQMDVTITSAELLALFATPKTLVAAPGAGKAIIFLGAVLTKAAGTAYAGIAATEEIGFNYTNAAGLQAGLCEATGFLDQATAQVRYVNPKTGAIAAATVSDITPVANAALVAALVVGEIITGDSDLKVRVFYRVIPTVL